MIAWNELYCQPLPEGHHFPMEKYNLIPEELVRRGLITTADLISPEMADEAIVALVHDPAYINMLKQQVLPEKMIRRIGFPLNQRLVEREFCIVQGTINGVLFALQNGLAFNVAGGTHHAFADRGEAYCLLNDVAVAAAYALKQKDLKQVLILDLDVHQGNGTAAIFQHRPEVFTVSIHEENAWPRVKQTSDMDIGLPKETRGEFYLDQLQACLSAVETACTPDLALLVSGVDVLQNDRLGGLNLTLEDCRQRDNLVFNWLKQKGIPAVVTMGGGYNRNVNDVVEAHCATFEEGIRLLV